MAPNVPSVHRKAQLSSEPYNQFRRPPILDAGQFSIAGITGVVLNTDRGQTFGVRVLGNVFVEHTFDDGPVPPDNVVCRLLAPYSMRCVPLLWRTKDIPRSDTGVNRTSVGGMEDDGVDLLGKA